MFVIHSQRLGAFSLGNKREEFHARVDNSAKSGEGENRRTAVVALA
mgnify:CR=1